MDLQTFLNASLAMAKNFVPLVSGALGMLAGIYLVGKSAWSIVKMGERQSQGENNWGTAGLQLLIGALLLQFGSTMQSVSQLLFGQGIQDYRGAMAYMPMPSGSAGFWRQVLEVCLIWVLMLGWIAAFRGFMQWSAAANGAGGRNDGDFFWKGVWHIVGGAAAINLTGVIQAFLGK